MQTQFVILDDYKLKERLVDAILDVDGTEAEALAIIEQGVDVNARLNDRGWTALHFAARADWRADEDRRMQMLIELGANLEARIEPRSGDIWADGWDWTPLHVAAWFGHAAQVKALVRAGANLDAVDSYGHSPVTLAIDSYEASEKTRELQRGAEGVGPNIRAKR